VRKRVVRGAVWPEAVRSAALCAALLFAGCSLAQLTPQGKFNDAAYTLNDAARWSNVDVATRYVDPRYMARFVSRHRLWGSQINIGEYELARLALAPDKKTAMSEVVLSWYDQGGVRLHSSTITQQWERKDGAFLLTEERVRAGDGSVLSEDEAPADAP
jgi:hypothetical protein